MDILSFNFFNAELYKTIIKKKSIPLLNHTWQSLHSHRNTLYSAANIFCCKGKRCIFFKFYKILCQITNTHFRPWQVSQDCNPPVKLLGSSTDPFYHLSMACKITMGKV